MSTTPEQAAENRRAGRERAAKRELDSRLRRGLAEQDRLTFLAHGDQCRCTRCARHHERLAADADA